MLEQSISDLLKKRNLGWNLNSEGLGLELVDSDCQHQEEGRFGSIPLLSERLYRCGICC